MVTLAEELQQTILNLEKIRDLHKPPMEEVLTVLDELYAQQLELVEDAIQKASPEYKKAATAMGEAAKHTQDALYDLAKLDKAIQKVAKAIGKVTVLLAAI